MRVLLAAAPEAYAGDAAINLRIVERSGLSIICLATADEAAWRRELATAGRCVRADLTATFVAVKAGFANPAAAAFTGPVNVLGIAPVRLLRRRRSDRPGPTQCCTLLSGVVGH